MVFVPRGGEVAKVQLKLAVLGAEALGHRAMAAHGPGIGGAQAGQFIGGFLRPGKVHALAQGRGVRVARPKGDRWSGAAGGPGLDVLVAFALARHQGRRKHVEPGALRRPGGRMPEVVRLQVQQFRGPGRGDEHGRAGGVRERRKEGKVGIGFPAGAGVVQEVVLGGASVNHDPAEALLRQRPLVASQERAEVIAVVIGEA